MSAAHRFVVLTGCASTSNCGVSPNPCDNANVRLPEQQYNSFVAVELWGEAC
jgi:hypothetical protein